MWLAPLLAALPVAASAAPITSAEPGQYTIGPAASWVHAQIPPFAGVAAIEARDGVEYLALDNQVRLTPHGADSYLRVVQRIVSEAGVKESSTITLDFDPQSDRIRLHSVILERGGRRIDQLGTARISVLRRESRLEEGLLDGELTLNLILEDVRPGDIVDYSYSRHQYDEALGNRYFDSYTTQFSSPLQWGRLRLLHPADRHVEIQQVGGSVDPVVRMTPGWQESTWEWHDLAGIHGEVDRPTWYPMFPRIRISEWRSWEEVVQWGIAQYRLQTPSPAMQELVAKWQAATDSRGGQILLALRFVQDQVRYTGLEIGAGAYRPTSPQRVLERRYGDCKDKVLLLVALLRALGVDANPALVNTKLLQHVSEVLPNPGAFDHAIVRVRHDGRSYWFDATSSLQGGTLQTTAQAHFGAALVIAPGVASLEPMSAEIVAQPATDVVEKFNLGAALNSKATLVATTVYRDADADRMRRDLQSSTSADLTRRYLDYYRQWYPGARSTASISSRDDRERNRIEVTENYEIENAFAAQQNGSLRFEVNPYLVHTHVKAPELAVRTTPLAVDHPVNVRYRAIVQLPDTWSPETGVTTIDDPAFHYRSDIKYGAGRWDASYEFRTLADQVEPGRVEAYAQKLTQVRQDANYSFTHAGQPAARTGGAFNVVLALGILAGIGAGAWVVTLLRGRLPDFIEPAPAGASSGIAGWLLLPALQTCLLPVLLARNLYGYRSLFDISAWNDVGAEASALMAQLIKLGYTLVAGLNAALIVIGCYAVLSLFKRSRRFPLVYVVAIWTAVGLAVLDETVAYYMTGSSTFAYAMRSFFAAMLWTVYIAKSTRVRATFVRDDPAPATTAATQPA